MDIKKQSWTNNICIKMIRNHTWEQIKLLRNYVEKVKRLPIFGYFSWEI